MRTRSIAAALGLGLFVLSGAAPATAAGRAVEMTWSGSQIRLYGAQAPGRDGAGVLVAVLDGWVDGSHPDFTGRVSAGANCTSGSCVSGQTADACTHGTHVAGTVAATSFGVASRARILPVQVLTSNSSGDCTGSPAAVAAGIRYAVAQGAKVLNLSLGPDVGGLQGGGDIPAAVHAAAQAGAVVVFSAGNAATATAQSYGSDALIVAATGPSGGLASYSERGAGVSLAAPGGQPTGADQDQCSQASCVTSLYPGGKYAVAAGTSMAAPHVSGVAALLFAQQPSRTAAQVEQRLISTARPLADAGAGLLDATAALGVTPRTTTPVTAAPVPATSGATTQTGQSVPTRPQRRVTPAPGRTTTKAPATTGASPRPAPSAAPAPTGSTLLLGEDPRQPDDDGVPVPLALLAGLLVAGAGSAVAVVRPRRR